MFAQTTRPPSESAPKVRVPAHAGGPRGAARPFSLPVDPLRGLVCLGVTVLHLYGGFRDPLRELFGPWAEFALTYLRLGVESFLLLGGFFVAHMLRPSDGNFVSVPRLFARRFLRLAVPYWAAVGIVLAATLAANVFLGRDNRLPPWPEVLAVATFTQDLFADRMCLLYPLWSMAPLFQYSALGMLVFWAVRRVMLAADPGDFQLPTRRVMVAVCVVLVVVGPAAAAAPWQLARWGCVLALGSLTYWWVTGAVGGRLYAAALAWFLAGAVDAGDVLRVKAAVASVLLAALGLGVRVPDSAATRGLAWVGRRSYSVYLVHGFVGVRVVNWSWSLVPGLGGDPPLCLAVLAAAVAASVAAGSAFYSAVERPVARLASGIEYRR